MQKIKNKSAFSFIELLIVISIIAIIGVFGISSFSQQIDNLRAKNILGEILGDISDLDNKLNSRKIFDYEIIFEKNKNYYLINENIFDLDNKLELITINNGTGELKISSGNSSATGAIKIYFGYKFIKQDIKNGGETFTGNLSEVGNYKIESSYSGSVLNNLYFKYFDKENRYELIQIDTNIGSNLNRISLKNVLGKKEFGNNSSINKMTLTFEDNLGKKHILEIKK